MTDIDYPSLHVLIIEDDDFLRKLTERVLRELRIGIISSAANGEEGLKQLRETIRPVDLILCDLMMPKMNGLDFVYAVRRGNDIPDREVAIIVVTSHADEEIVRGAAKLGVDGYLVKPINRSALEARMAAALARRDGHGRQPPPNT